MKVGDYVRLCDDIGMVGIGKIIKKEKNDWYIIKPQNGFELPTPLIGIKKSSPNIIDLIEVGDYVNGYEIIDIIYEKDNIKYLETEITKFDNVYPIGNVNIYKNDIKSILTKEQFESMEYRIGE